ncbi:MAG: hypothetical protein RIQ55_152 [Pseudomonadota bacterium]|jgi:hypothetical protein
MTSGLRKGLAVAALALFALASQPALADGWRHHGYGRFPGANAWVPFALGAVVGGVALGAMLQPQPIVVQPVYAQPPVYGRPRVIVPPPGYMLMQPPPVYYSY